MSRKIITDNRYFIDLESAFEFIRKAEKIYPTRELVLGRDTINGGHYVYMQEPEQ